MHQLTVAQCQSSAEPTARGKLGQAWWKINGFCPPSCTKIHSGERKGTSLVDDAACLIPRQFRRKLCFFVFFFFFFLLSRTEREEGGNNLLLLSRFLLVAQDQFTEAVRPIHIGGVVKSIACVRFLYACLFGQYVSNFQKHL